MSLALAISTSSPMLSVALVNNGVIIAEQMRAETSHSRGLMPLVDEILNSFGIACSNIDFYAVDTGPGSFTGVRIGVAAANGMAFGASKPVVGVSSLLSFRYKYRDKKPLAVMLDARNDNIYAALFDAGDKSLAPYAADVYEFLDVVPPRAYFAGDGAFAYAPYMSERFDSNHILGMPQGADEFPQAGYIGVAAFDLIAADINCLVKQTEPTYCKLSQAEKNVCKD